MGKVMGPSGGGATLLELVAGVFLASLFGQSSMSHLMGASELGVLVLFFLLGLEVRPEAIRSHLKPILAALALNLSLACAVAVILVRLGWIWRESAVVGAVLMTSGTGLVMRVLQQESKLQSKEGRLLLSASLSLDLLALGSFALVSKLAMAGGAAQGGWIGVDIVAWLGLLILVVGVVGDFGPRKVDSWWVLPLLALAAWTTRHLGLPTLVGALAVGIWFRDRQSELIESYLKPLSQFLIPLYIVTVGWSVPVEAVGDPRAWELACLLTLVAVLLGGIGAWVAVNVCGQAEEWQVVAWGLIPRGLPGIALATLGKEIGILGSTTYMALVLMIAMTNLVGISGLAWRLRRGSVLFWGLGDFFCLEPLQLQDPRRMFMNPPQERRRRSESRGDRIERFGEA